MATDKHVAVLMGGLSAEREVSLVSGAAAGVALRRLGFTVTEIDVGTDLARDLRDIRPDIAFNALHGQWGEDGCVQGLLEVMQIPYTHSGVLASSLAMDKQKAKAVFGLAGIPVPEGLLVTREAVITDDVLSPPYVVKPNAQGSSVGIHIIRPGDNRAHQRLMDDTALHGDDILVERFIAGRELTVAVMGDRPLCVTEILPATDFYDYEAKYAEGGSVHHVPADIPETIADRACEMSLKAHNILGCRGLTRTDFRYDPEQGENGLFCLEINTQPGLTPTSLAPEQAAHCGISFEDLIVWMVEDASCLR